MRRVVARPLVVTLVASACADSIPPPVATSIDISPLEAVLGVGETLQLTVVLRDQRGAQMDVRPTYASTNPGVVSVSALTGLVTAAAPGSVMVIASYEALTASAAITVLASFTLDVTANTHSYTYNDQTQLYECDLEVTASASGERMTDYALWTSGEVQFRYAAGGSLTIFLGRQDLINRFGSDRIFSGQTQTWRRVALSRNEFDLLLTYRATLPDSSGWSDVVDVICVG